MRRPFRSHATSSLLVATLVLLALSGGLVSSARADLMVVGNDQKVVFDAEGNRSFVAPGSALALPSSDVSIMNVDGTTITDTGKKLNLPGQPASMRGRAR